METTVERTCKNCGGLITKEEFGWAHSHGWMSCEGYGEGPPFGQPEPDPIGKLIHSYYSTKMVETLKANTPFGNSWYKVPSSPVPESVPPKRAMPKAVPDTNGRKFRDEE